MIPDHASTPLRKNQPLLTSDCPAYILCGGQSARFGTDKARVLIEGTPQLLRLADTLRAANHAVHFLADRSDRYEDLGLSAIEDAHPQAGPIGGLIAAALHCQDCFGPGWYLLVSCDQLHWDPAFFAQLSEQASENVFAVVFRDVQLQPIPGLYSTAIIRDAQRAVATGDFSIKRLLESIPQHVVAIKPDGNNPREWCFNDQEELQRALGRRAD